jgi:CelD/BcsL family acetyltransferase involved in cellulose biosynthesis
MEWLSERTWQGQKLGHIVRANAEERERFEALADQGWLRCYLLKNGAEPLAFVLGRQMDNLYHWEEIGYDPAWAKYAPGKALLYLHLEDLFAEKRPDWLDMGRGPYGYKAFFANYCYEEANAYLIRKSLYMSVAMGLPAAGDQIKRVGRARFRRLLRKG